MSYLGIDIGTSSVKAIAYNDLGEAISFAKKEYSVINTQDGFAELDIFHLTESCFEVIKQVGRNTIEDPICSIAISCQGEAFTVVDQNGRPLCNAMVSSDYRAKEICTKWSEQFGTKQLYEITGHTPHPIFTIYKILWIKENRPHTWGDISKILCLEDYLQYKLGIEPCISYSLAGRTMMFDIRTKDWSHEILKALGIRKEQMSRPVASGQIVGGIPNNIANELSLPFNVKIVSGGHDQGCGAIGASVNKSGEAMYALGTVECIAAVFDRPTFSQEMYLNNLCTYHHVNTNFFLTLAYSLTGGNLIEWCRKELAHEDEIFATINHKNVYDVIINNLPDQPTNLIALPYFVPGGTPYFETEIGATITNVRISTTKYDIMKAFLESVTLEIALNLEIMKNSGIVINQLNVIGGGANSRKLLQMKADILGIKLIPMKVTEAGCIATAMLGYSAIHSIHLKDVASNWIIQDEPIIPQEENVRIYQDKFVEYKSLYLALKERLKKK